MATAKVALGLDDLSVDEKVTQFATIEQMMGSNSRFDKAVPALADVRAKCDAMLAKQTARNQAKLVAEQATTELNTAEGEYEKAATALAAYVESVAQGDKAVIQSAGMPAVEASAGRPLGKLPAPEGLTATMGDEKGEVDAHWNPIKGARAYAVSYGQSGPDNLTKHTVVTRSKAELTGLTSGQEVWVQVTAVGAEGGTPSQAVRCMVP